MLDFPRMIFVMIQNYFSFPAQ